MPQPEVCSSEGDADSQRAMSDTQSEPSSEELLGDLSSASHSPSSKLTKLRGPAPPPANPLQFVKIKPPTHLYTAPPVKKPAPERIRKEEAEDWQNDLDGWKANRRKRQEHLLERVSEFKRQDSDPGGASRKSKTFSEMMKARKHNLVVYDDDNEINFSELGLGNAREEQTDEQSDSHSSLPAEEETPVEEVASNNSGSETNGQAKYVEESKKVEVKSERKDKKQVEEEEECTYESAIKSYAEFSATRLNISKNLEQPILNNNVKDENSNNKYAATAVREVKVVTETIVVSDSEDFMEAEEQPEEVKPKFEASPPRAAPVIKSSVVKRLSGTSSSSSTIFSKMEHFNNNNREICQSKDEPSVITTALSSSSSSSRLENIEIKPITDKISRFEKSIEESVLFNPPKKHRPPVPNKPPKTAPPPIPTEAPPTVPKEEEVSPAPSYSCHGLPDTSSSPIISDLPRVLSPRDRSPLGGEDSGVHTADSVSQSDEVDDEVDNPLPISSGLLGMINSPIVDDELSALLAPPTKMEPPREKPPPPPPVGTADDTEIMRKCFLGLEITNTPPSVPPPIPPVQSNEKKDEFLSNQLKEKLLKLEEEKNNVINLEKKVTAERLPQIVQDYSLSAQERLAAEREALRLERELLQQAKLKQQQELSFAKKLAMRSLESLDIIPAEPEGRDTPPDEDYHTAKNTPVSGSPQKVRQQQQHDYANLPEQQHLRKAQSEEQVQKQERTYVNQAFFQPPQPRYSSLYEDPYNYEDKQEPVVYRKKAGPPPPVKPTNRHSTSALLTRNFSADSILESADDSNVGPAVPRRDPLAPRPSLPLSCSMSQLPKQQSLPSSQQPQLKSQRPRSSSAFGLTNYHQHWLVQEAEHRRITEQQQRQAVKQQPKHLPDAIIMSLTQRVQQKQNSQLPQRVSPQRSPPQRNSSSSTVPSVDDKVLSVSGKKKCSHCNLELETIVGRGAAMIIESLRLFYHIDCFKCCVCCIQLGDGLMGTDVRVRNGKLHCHSCYSSDDGVKFSCV
ncbi:titin isoform X4 [Neocloeon triangulifer]|uniref:titin isoform X4 n=1 Tax=Neocloeon triangulifer TaxID=2078957 RepID=UPI00286EF936|nr:titin isoform X4 [Neocloeon triangulifer]